MKFFRLLHAVSAFCFNLPFTRNWLMHQGRGEYGVVTYAEVEEFAAPAARRCGGNMPAAGHVPENFATRQRRSGAIVERQLILHDFDVEGTSCRTRGGRTGPGTHRDRFGDRSR